MIMDGSDFWKPKSPDLGYCWICGGETRWVYLDIGYQHKDCDAGPAGPRGLTSVVTIRGKSKLLWTKDFMNGRR